MYVNSNYMFAKSAEVIHAELISKALPHLSKSSMLNYYQKRDEIMLDVKFKFSDSRKMKIGR
jgi:hypothetical protein